MTSLPFGGRVSGDREQARVRLCRPAPQSRFSLARVDGVKTFRRFCLSTEAALEREPVDARLTIGMDEKP